MIAFRRQSIEGDEENAPQKMILPSPRREPLRPLRRNTNSRDSLSAYFSGSANDEALMGTGDSNAASNSNSNSKPPLITKPRTEFESNTPIKTPKATKPSTPMTGGRTPNEGKILSPLPLQQRKLRSAQKAKVKIDTEEFLSSAPCIPTPTNPAINEGSCVALDYSIGGSINADDDILDLRISKPFDEDETCSNHDDNSLGWAYTIDDFNFVRKLGSGGSADVYEVVERGTCALYALKVQPATEDALCELDLHIPMKHKNICQMFDYFYVNGKPFLDYDKGAIDRGEDVMKTRYLCTMLESCDHGDLHDLIDEHVAVPESIAAKAMIEAINALQYLHSNDIIHCDVKPANWLVHGEDDNAVIKLADFGMAVTSDAKEVVGGSPVYMASEHLVAWRDLTDNFDHRTDIYSLGVVLYEMLMGYLPYEVLEAEKSRNSGAAESGNVDNLLVKEFLDLSVSDPEDTNDIDLNNGYPVLDLRKLNDATSDQPFYIPPPIFVEDISTEAQDLILRLMEPSASKRITLEEARQHDWFRKVL